MICNSVFIPIHCRYGMGMGKNSIVVSSFSRGKRSRLHSCGNHFHFFFADLLVSPELLKPRLLLQMPVPARPLLFPKNSCNPFLLPDFHRRPSGPFFFKASSFFLFLLKQTEFQDGILLLPSNIPWECALER